MPILAISLFAGAAGHKLRKGLLPWGGSGVDPRRRLSIRQPLKETVRLELAAGLERLADPPRKAFLPLETTQNTRLNREEGP